MRRSFGIAWGVGVAALLTSTGVAAQPTPSLDLRLFRPPVDPAGSLYLEPTATPGQGNWNVGVWFSHAIDPIVLEDENGEAGSAIAHQSSVDYVASLGLLSQLAVGITLPTVIYQDGDDVGGLAGTQVLPQTAVGDIGFVAKATLVPTEALGGFGLAALGEVTGPSGDRRSYLGEGKATGGMRLLGEMRWPGLAVRGTAGAKIRSRKRIFANEEFGHDLPWGLGFAIKPQVIGLDNSGRWEVMAEARGAIAFSPEFGSGPQSPVMAGLSTRFTSGDISFLAGLELPLSNAVGVPTVRPVFSVGWAPRFLDEDGDGVGDETDECTELAEDRDGFEDADGCPDFDDDDDGVPDDSDQCKSEAEDEDDFEDDDGCPDPDNDRDGIADEQDACRNEAGPATGDPKTTGCPVLDTDGDGVLDDGDRCIDQPEDVDGFKDEDGCPDPDNDRDSVLDEEDACPLERGLQRSDPELNGCPNPDSDGDTFDDKDDKCPNKPEDFDGVEDEDGCPDLDDEKPVWQRAKPLVEVEQKAGDLVLKWRIAPRFVGTGSATNLDPKTSPSLRALAQMLNTNPTWIVAVGVRPSADTSEAAQAALGRSFVIAHELRTLTHRDSVAETVGWAAVKQLPNATRDGLGVLVFAPPGTKPK